MCKNIDTFPKLAYNLVSYLLDGSGRDAGSLEGGLHGLSGQLRRGHRGERGAERADRRARGANDEHGLKWWLYFDSKYCSMTVI